MLGRLFNSKSNSNLPELTSFTTNPSLNHNTPISLTSSPLSGKLDFSKSDDYSDSYTRALLYGTPKLLTSTPFDTSLFRIVIIQDGSMRSKNVLYDSSVHVNQGVLSLSQSQSGLSQSQLHSQLPSQISKPDNSKNHNLMELSDYMFGCGVPTSEWSISTKLHSLPSLPKLPSSFLITRLFSLNSKFSVCSCPEKKEEDWQPQSSLPLPQSAPQRDSTRFGIGLIIPLESSDLQALVTTNWEAYINFMAIFQAFVISKLKLQCTMNPNGCLSLHKDKKDTVCKVLSFPSYVLQGDIELQNHLNNLIKLTHSLLQVPRLLVGIKRSDATLFNWCYHAAGWLEFKDGKNLLSQTKLEFLASLFVILIPLRRELLTNNPSDKSNKITRVVIMTGNPAVVQKLIFIIMGILSNDVLFINTDRVDNSIPQPSKSINISKDSTPSSPIGSSSSTTPSLASSFSKGWEIPTQTPSIPTTTVTAKPVNFSPLKKTEGSSTSLQYLSSSLSSSYTASSWKQASFLDKWRSSVTLTNDHNLNQHDSLSKSAQTRRLSNLRTPSPGVEYEEYPWTGSNNMHSSQHLKSTRNQTSFDLSISAASGIARYNASECENINRTPTTVKGTLDVDLMYQNECKLIMSSDPTYTLIEDEHHTNFFETPPLSMLEEGIDHNFEGSADCILKPLVGYVEEFRPEFSLQACPIKLGLGQEIINTMKNDLIDHSFVHSKVPKTVSKTIFVSLAAREIKEFEVKSLGVNESLSTSPGPNMVLATDCVSVKKIFSPRKKDIDHSKVIKVDQLLDIIIDLAKSIGVNNTAGDHNGGSRLSDVAPTADKIKFDKIRKLLVYETMVSYEEEDEVILGGGRGQKSLPSKPQLFLEAEDKTEEALKAFIELKTCHYANKSVGNSNQDEQMTCDCREEFNGDINLACGAQSDCINRLTSVECTNGECNCGDDCQNQRFQKREYADVSVIQTEKKGYGLRANTDIPIDTFIYEYIGEVIDEAAFRSRMRKYDENGLKHFYFMMLQKNEFIDATSKGCLARFCNHSCRPNSFVDKWVVGKKLKMGIFSKRNILKGEEITFDYNVDRYGAQAQPCYCGESNCIGFMGGKTQTDSASLLPQIVAEALGVSPSEEKAWLKMMKLNGKKIKKESDSNINEEFVGSLQMRPLETEEVSKVMSALLRSQEVLVCRKLIERIWLTSDNQIHTRIIRMHGYEIFSALIRDNWDNPDEEDMTIHILEILSKWPKITKNKISSSKIEHVLKEVVRGTKNNTMRSLASDLLKEWSSLEMAYRIPKKSEKAENSESVEVEVKIENLPPSRVYDNTLLPDGWEWAVVPDTNKVYFYNRLLNVTQWNRPEDKTNGNRLATPPDHHETGFSLKRAVDDEDNEVHKTMIVPSKPVSYDKEEKLQRDKLRLQREMEESEKLRILRELEYQKREEEAKKKAQGLNSIIEKARKDAEARKLAEQRIKDQEEELKTLKLQRQLHKSRHKSLEKKISKSSLQSSTEKKYKKLFAGVVPNMIKKFENEIGHENIKKCAKDIVNALTEKELKRHSDVDVPVELSNEKKSKIKIFAKSYMEKFMIKYKEKESRKRQREEENGGEDAKKIKA